MPKIPTEQDDETMSGFAFPQSVNSQPKQSTRQSGHRRRGNVYARAIADMDVGLLLADRSPLISSLTPSQSDSICNLMNVGYGANWKQIASYYEFSGSQIREIERQENPSKILLNKIVEQNTNARLSDLTKTCRRICRNDIARVVEAIIAGRQV